MPSDDKNKKKPKKASAVKKKITSNALSALDASSATQQSILPVGEALMVEEVIKQAFLRFYDTAQVKQHKVKDLEHLDVIVSEFLKTFAILGYDLNGEKICIMHASNPHDRDALVEHLRTTLLGIINQQ
jgi:hypothetical protein